MGIGKLKIKYKTQNLDQSTN